MTRNPEKCSNCGIPNRCPGYWDENGIFYITGPDLVPEQYEYVRIELAVVDDNTLPLCQRCRKQQQKQQKKATKPQPKKGPTAIQASLFDQGLTDKDRGMR